MEITTGAYDKATRTVAVTFAHNGVTHHRPVNAVLNARGQCDHKATAARVEEVALGIAHKIGMGVLK
jgi:hypothetical protein